MYLKRSQVSLFLSLSTIWLILAFVGGIMGFSYESMPQYDEDILDQETMEELLATPGHCRYAFDVLLAKLNNQQIPPYPQGLPDPSAPIFVTWKINGKLNGCIGTFAASKMSKTLSRFALISAFEDDRFPQLTLNDLPKLNVVVSMLKNFRTAKSPYDFQIGKHGVIMYVQHNGEDYQSTYLPQVPPLNKWDHEKTLRQLVKKSKFPGTLEDVVDKIILTTYETTRSTMDYTAL